MGSNLSVKIPLQRNPLLSGEHKIKESTELPTEFKFHLVAITTINRAIGKMKKSLGFGSDGIASNVLKIAFPVICNPICDIFNFSIFSGSFPDSWKKPVWPPFSKEESLMTVQITDLFLFYLSFQDSSKSLYMISYTST